MTLRVCTREKSCPATSHYGNCESMPFDRRSWPLEKLLEAADSLFSKQYEGQFTYNYSLGRFPNGWQFNVTNNWYRWNDRGLKHNFGVHSTPKGAVLEFLEYVEANNITVADLMGDVHETQN